MTALAAARTLPDMKAIDHATGGIVLDMAVIADDIVYKGAFMEIIAAGHVGPLNSGTAIDFAGIALETVSNVNGSAADVNVKVLTGPVIIDHAVTGADISSIGDIVYAADDQVLTMVATSNEAMGWFLQLTGTAKGLVLMKTIGAPAS